MYVCVYAYIYTGMCDTIDHSYASLYILYMYI